MAKCTFTERSLYRKPKIKNPVLIFSYAVICAGTMIALAGYNTGERQAISEDSTAQDPQTATPKQEPTVGPTGLESQIEFSRKDLSKRLGIEPVDIAVDAADLVSWRSGALGCPEPGMNYTQALVPGVLIFLQVGNEVHGYHAQIGAKPFYCPRQRAEQPLSGQGADMT